MKTLVLGLGNPILGDDSVGMRVAGELKRQIDKGDVEVKEAPMCRGLNILGLIQGYDKVIVIDAIQAKDGRPGQIHRLKPSDLKGSIHLSWPHEINFATAIELGKRLQIPMPEVIDIYAVEIEENVTFTEECTPELSKAIPKIVRQIMAEEFGQTK
jgi:hydrogenase maturation protease